METETNLPEDASATGIGLSESISKVCTEKEQIEHQSETQSMEKEIIKHTNSEETMTMERSTKLSYDMEELEKIPESHSDENSNIKDGGNIMPEEAKYIKEATDKELQKPEIESVHDDKATSTVPTIASVQVETVAKSIHEEIHEGIGSAVKDTNEKQGPDNDYEENTKVLQALDSHEATVNTCVENEKKDEPHYHVQKQETADFNLNLGLDTAKINPSNDTGELEKALASHTPEKLEIMDGGKINEEAETEIQMPNTAIESVPKDEALSILPESVELDQGEIAEKSFEKEKEEESTATDNGQSCRPGKELEQIYKALEEIDHLPQIVAKDAAENEHTYQSETPGNENISTKHSEGKLTMESSTKSSYDVEELAKISESHSVDNSETKCDGKLMAEKEIGIKEATEVKLQKSETASVPADKALSTLHPTVSVGVQTVEESIQVEIHNKVEQSVTTTKEEQRSDNDFEEKKNVLEACDLHEATSDTCVENEKKEEIETEELKLETIVVKPLDLEGETIEVNMSNDSEGHEKVPESPPSEELEIKEGRIWIQEEAKDIEEAIEDEALSTLPTSANVQGEATEEIFQKQNLMDEDPAAMDKCNSSQPEYELEQITNVFEACDLHEAKRDTCVENGKIDGIITELQNQETIVVKHLDLEGEAIEVNMSNETEGHEKVPVSPTKEELDIKEGRKCIQEEAKDIEEAIEDEASLTLPTSAIAKGDAIDEIFQKQSIKEEESAAMDKGNSSQPEYELEQTTNVVEVNDQSETMAYVGVHNEQNSVQKSDAPTREIVITEDINAGGMATIESSKESTYVVDEQEIIPESHSVNNSEIEDGSKMTADEATDIHQATDMEIKKSIIESALSTLHTSPSVEVDRDEESIQEEMKMKEEILEDDAQSKLLMLEIEKGEMVKGIVQQQTLLEEEPEAIDTDKSCRPEKELEKLANVAEAVDQPKTIAKVSAENGEQEDHQSIASSIEIAIINIKLINEEGKVTSASSSKSSYDTNKLEKIPQSPSVADSFMKDDSKIMSEEQTDIKESPDVELEKAETESVPEDKALTSLHNTASVTAETVEESIKEELYVEAQPAVIDTKEGQIAQNNLEEKKIPKEFCLDDITCYTSVTNEQEIEPQFEVQNLETIITKHSNLDGDTTEINLTNDTEEHEKFLVSHTREKLKIEDDGKFTPEEAKAMEQTLDMQILKTATQSVPEDEAHSEFPKLAIVKGETEEILPQHMLEEEESAVGHNNKSNSPENELDERANMVEEIDQPESIAKACEENENADHQIKASNMESVITNEISAEGNKTPESSRKSSNDVDEKDQCITTQEEEENITRSADREFKTESVLEDISQPTLPNTVFYGVEAVETCIPQELHKAEYEVRDIKEEQRQERDFEDEKQVPEVFGLHKVTNQASAENEQQAEPWCKAQNQDTTFTTHRNLEGQTTNIINPSSDADEQENVPISQTAETLETEEDGKFKQEEANEKEEATELQLLEPAAESVPEDKALETVPSTEFVADKADEGSIEEKIQEEELAVINTTERMIPENDLEVKKNVPKAFDLHKVTRQTSEENELKAEYQSEAKNQETTFIQHLNMDAKTTHIINPINDTEEQEMVPESHSGEKLELEDVGELKKEEAKEMEEATVMQILKTASESVPEDKAKQTLPSRASIGLEEVETSIQEEMHAEAELAVTDTEDHQIPENNFEEKKKESEAFGLHDVTHQTSDENEQKDEPQFEALNRENTSIQHLKSEGKTKNVINPTSDCEELDNVQVSQIGEILEIQDDGNLIQREEKEMEEAIEMQSPNSASKMPEDNANTTSAGIRAAEESIQEENYTEEELAVTNTKVGQKPEIDFKEEKKVPEAFDELKLEPQSLAHNEMTTFIKHPHMEGKTTDTINPTNDNEEHENVSESHTGGKLEIKDDGKSIQEEAKVTEVANGMQLLITPSESVPEDKAQETLPSTTSVGVEAVATSIQEVPAEAELSMANTKQGHIPELDFERKKLPEALGLHEVTLQDSVENELNAEYHSEERNQAITFITHTNLEGQTTKINPTNDTGDQEQVSASQSREKLDIEDEGKFIQEEAKEMEKATEMQSAKTETQSVPEDNPQSSLPNTPSVDVDVDVDETSIQQETHMEVELAVSHSKEIPKNDFNEENNVPEAFGLHEVIPQTNVENELKAEHQSEEQNQETTFIKDPNLEEDTLDKIKPTNDIEEQERFTVSHVGEKLESVKDGKFLQGEAEVIEEATEMKLLKTARESLPEDEAKSTMPKFAFVKGENEEIIQQQTLQGDKSAAIECDKGCSQENELGKTADVAETFHLQEVTHQTSTENEHNAEPLSEVQNHEISVIEHPNLEGETTEINQTNDIEEDGKIPVSPTRQKLEIIDDGKFIPEEPTKMQLLETATESVPEDENQSTLPKSSIVHVEKVEEFFLEEESAAIPNNNSCQPENELEQTVNAAEEIDQLETTSKISTENEEHAEHQSEQFSMKNVIAEHINSEGIGTKLSYDVEEILKVPESDTVDKSEIKDTEKIMQEEETDIREATVKLQKPAIESVPEDNAISPLSTKPSGGVEAVKECIQEENKKDDDSAFIHIEEGQRSSNDYVECTKVLEAFDLQKKAEPHSNAQIMDTTVIKHSNTGGLETAETSPILDIEELDKISVSHTTEKLEIKQEEAKEKEEVTEIQSVKTATESVHDDEAQSILPTSETVKGEMVEQSIQEQTFKEKESAAIDSDKSSRAENERQQTTIVFEAIVQPETTYKVSAEKDENADHNSEAPRMKNKTTEQINSDRTVTTESRRKASYDEDEWEKISESYLVNNSEIKDAGEVIPKEEMNIKATALELQNSEIESMPEDKVFSILSTIAPFRDDTFQKSFPEEIHKEAEFAVTDAKEGQRPENELVEDKKDLEASDLQEVTGYTWVEGEKKAEAQSLEAMVLNDLNLEGKETAGTCTTNDTKALEKEPMVVIPEGVSELLSVYITKECSNEDIPQLKDMSMLSDQNTTNVTSARRCNATSKEKNSEETEGQENSETTFKDNRTGDLSHEQETTDGTPTEKIVRAADTNKDPKLAPESIAEDQGDKNNCYDTMYKVDVTSTDDEKGEKVRNNLESNITSKVAEKLDADGQSGMHESTKKERRELLEDKIPEPPYPCKKLESLFDSEAHNQTNEKLYHTKEKGNNILDQISESDDHIQGKQFQSANQIKPEPQMEGEHNFSIPLNENPISIASIKSEVHDGVDSADGSENIEKQTMGSGKILSEAQISFPREETVEQNFKATESNEQRVITDLSLGSEDPIQQEATSRDSNEATDREPAEKLETQETEITQEGNAKEDEFENVIIKSSRDTDMMKASPKKSHGILSGVGSKVKHSISKVKKAITGKSSSHPKGPSAK